MNVQNYENYVADFETTVYEGQKDTQVWAAAIISMEMPTDPRYVMTYTTLDEFMKDIFSWGKNKKIYFHNAKFDLSFVIPWLYHNGFQVWSWLDDNIEKLMDRPIREMPGRTFTCLISDTGQWYSLTIKWKNKIIIFQDSLKLLPFSVEAVGKAFDTKYRKLVDTIEYKGKRTPGTRLTKEEEDYLKNDVLVMHEALNKLFRMTGEEKMTIGSLCMSEFRTMCFHDDKEFKAIYPDLTKISCPIEGFENADEYIRKGYHGGWCYLKPEKANRKENPVIIKDGCTADVNSLYPSVMHSDSGSVYPYGKPRWWTGNIPEEVQEKSDRGRYYYYVRIRTRFYIKDNMLPTVQIKHSPLYPSRQWLTNSDVKGSSVIHDVNGRLKKCTVEMVMTQTDYKLLRDHYNLKDLEILDGCYFLAEKGRFDAYIDKWAKIKQESKGAMRTLAKLFLNNLYGKLASSTNSSYRIPFLDNDGILKARIVDDHNKDAGYIAVGAAITSYARNFTIRHAQENFDHFIYADTDSIHCDCQPDELINIAVHPTAFNHWKIENCWDYAVFVRAKTYIEHTIKEDMKECEPYYLVKCAGMGKGAKKKTIKRLETCEITVKDFTFGYEVDGNLKATQIPGGTVLVDRLYKIA